MQIIQTIRDKGAAIVIGVIALSLIGFILMDAKQGNGKFFGSSSTKAGKVNGDVIEFSEFNDRVRAAEALEEQRTQQKVTGTRVYQIREQTWNQIVAERIFFKEAEKLGIELTGKELSYLLYSNDPSNPLLQEQGLVDPTTGKLNVAEVQKALANIKKVKGEQRDNINTQLIEPLRLSTTVAKYAAFISASAYYPTWMQQKDNKESKEFSTISFVSIPYSEISDSTIKVSDDDVNEYVKKHKDLFKQEAGRAISYLTFSQLPSSGDSVKVMNQMMELKSPFQADSNAKAFVAKNTSVVEFEDEFKPKSKYNSTVIDTIVNTPAGTVSGPFVDGRNYVIAKVLGTKPLPDSVRAKHILISLQSGISDADAKKRADSILAAINGGADFGALAAQYSSDGTKDKGGDLGVFSYGQMVPEFNNFTFNKPVGTRDVVKTQFGYHVIEITSQSNFNTAYKIAIVAKEILPSDQTINESSIAATKASAQKDAKSLSAYAAKTGLGFTQVPGIVKENDYSVGALQDARQVVQWAFKAKKGDVSEPFNVGEQFVVAVVDKIQEEGIQDAATARPGAEVIIRNQKKAEIIIKKIGATPTLESAAAAYNKSIAQAGLDSSITMNTQMINGIGLEAKVIGACFNKNYQQKPSPAFGGTNAVYVLKIDAIGSKPQDAPDQQAQALATKLSTLRSQTSNWYEGLKKLADIKDTRSAIQ